MNLYLNYLSSVTTIQLLLIKTIKSQNDWAAKHYLKKEAESNWTIELKIKLNQSLPFSN